MASEAEKATPRTTAAEPTAMWCTDCGVRLRQSEIKGWGCPKCGSQGIPCAPDKDVMVEVNWHELHILCVWAENWAARCKANHGPDDDSAERMPRTVAAIASRLQHQWPDLGALTLSGEIAELPEQLAERGVKISGIDSNIPKPERLIAIGPGAVGFARKRADV